MLFKGYGNVGFDVLLLFGALICAIYFKNRAFKAHIREPKVYCDHE